MKKRKILNIRDGFFSMLFKNLPDDVRWLISFKSQHFEIFKSHIYGNQGDDIANLIFKHLYYINNIQE